jgi:hypothetical protein
MFTIRFSEEEFARLDLVAKHYGLTAAGALRMLLKREQDSIRGAARRTPSKSKRRRVAPREG